MSFGISLTSTNTGFVKAGSRQTQVNCAGAYGNNETIYTVPAGKSLYLLGCSVSNSSVTTATFVALYNGGTTYYLYCAAPINTTYTISGSGVIAIIPAGTTIKPIFNTPPNLAYVTLWGWIE